MGEPRAGENPIRGLLVVTAVGRTYLNTLAARHGFNPIRSDKPCRRDIGHDTVIVVVQFVVQLIPAGIVEGHVRGQACGNLSGLGAGEPGVDLHKGEDEVDGSNVSIHHCLCWS